MAKSSAGSSKLAYRARFSAKFLMPGFWATWLSVSVLFVLNLLPMAVTDGVANMLGDLAREINAKRRRIARKNLQLCFPGLSATELKRMLKQVSRAQVRSVLHYGLIWWAPKSVLQKRIEVIGLEHIEASRQAGRSVIVMTSHSVGLEAAVTIISMHYPVSAIFKKIKNLVTNWLIFRGRSRFGTILYSRDVGLRPVIKDVRAGQVLFYLSDEDLGRDQSVFVPFFGIPKATIPVLGRLAKSCNADVLPCISCYDESRHKYVIHILPAMQNFPEGDDEQDAARMNQAIEETVGICPEQYFWTLRLFRTRPEGETRFY